MKKSYFRRSVKKDCKSMYLFLKNHFRYYTMNSWNCLKSIANNVKLYNLDLEGDWCNAYQILIDNNWIDLEWLIKDFEEKHKWFYVGFNGRSGGYLVLYDKSGNGSILPKYIEDTTDYEDFKQYAKEYGYNVKDFKNDLMYYVEVVQDFDKLCDNMRLAVNEMSKMTPEEYKKLYE